jgi:DNA polymerase I-like protein with 3'-5' exonuclease and polymerase domains
MRTVTIDFETYYSKDFSLSKITTENYIRHKDFQTIGFAYKVNDEEPQWITGSDDKIAMCLAALDLENSYVIAHNMAFDGAILAWRYGIVPKYYIDTLSMARPITGLTVGGSLSALAKKFALGEKGTEVINALGKRREDFTPQQMALYGEYCKNDVQLTWNLYHILRKFNPPKEMYIQDLMLRMFTDPVLELDKVTLEDHLTNVQLKKKKLMDRIDASIGRDALMSNPKFAEVLTKLGVTPPTKISLRTQKETYAFGKTDQEFKALLEHHNPAVQAVVAARLGVKSTLEETRTESFLGIAERGPLPILLNYWGAHTGRASGGDKMNLQNLPRGGALRKSIKAPPGHKLIAVDSSQIEARVVAWFAGQADLVEDFRNNVDIYSKFASYVYGRPIDRKRKEIDPTTGKEFNPDKVEGFVGKTCLAEGTLVLCDSGWKRIEHVLTTDKLWDGQEWVCHQGLVNNGIKPTLNLSGLWLTPDHLVWSGTQWLEAQSVEQDAHIRSLALATAAENLPSQATYGALGAGYQTSSCTATATVSSTAWTPKTSKTSKAPVAHFAPRLRVLPNGTGYIQTRWPMTDTELVYSTDWQLPLPAATAQPTGPMLIMAGVAYQLPSSGALTAPRFFDMFKRWMGGIARTLRWTGSTSTGTTSQETSGSSPEVTTCATSGESLTSKRNLQVYDLACAGPRHRFTVLTEDGPLIVHNCILGLGYGMGWEKFRGTLKIGQGGISVDFEEEQAKNTVNVYRNKYAQIAQSWKTANGALDTMARGFETELGQRLPLRCTPEGIHLPNRTMIRYPDLTMDRTTGQYEYKGRYGPVKIYGGKVIENVVQALARIVVFDQMAKIDQHMRKLDGTNGERYKVVLTVHDEVVAVVPEHYAQTALDFMVQTMSTPPSWAADLPVACEGDIGDSYGDAK